MAIAKNYRPFVKSRRGNYWGTAMVGTHSAVIGWNVDKENIPNNLMGFSIKRTSYNTKTGKTLSKKWLNGQKRFKIMADAGPDVPSDQCPFQRFRWSDYTLKPARSYLYEVFPMTGEPGNLEPQNPLRFNVKPSQYLEDGIGIYVNRGVTAALAYLDRFGKRKPRDDESGAALKWLERGLKKSVLDFIARAKKGEALHLAIYEFFDHEIAAAFKSAKRRGVDVLIVYHAKDGDKATHENEDVIRETGLQSVAIARTKTGNISHNKFIVHLNKRGKPVRLLTASANFTENAFYYQTNVGIVFNRPELAAAYENYFQILRRNLPYSSRKKSEITTKTQVIDLIAMIDGAPPAPASRVLFSPVRKQHVVEEAIHLIEQSNSALFLSAPFGLGGKIIEAIESNGTDILEYGLANSTAKKKIEKLRRGNTRFHTPSRLETYMGRAWDSKAFGAHKIHAKTLVIDPWSDNPAVLIGSANFSKGSCVKNDENTLLIRGDKRVTAVVTTEFLRMYDHYKSRYWINRLRSQKVGKIHYLNDKPSWSDMYYKQSKNSRKFRDRIVFAGGA